MSKDVHMKELPLNDGSVALVDDEDFERLSRFGWRLAQSKHDKHPYVVRKRRTTEPASPTRIPLHREVLQRVWDLPPGWEVDHINRDTLDNQKANLRIVSRRGNASNRRDTSKHGAGILLDSRRKSARRPFVARVWVNGKYTIVGRFRSAEAALRAREAFLVREGLAMPVDQRRDSSCLEISQGGPIPQTESDGLPPPW